MFLSIKLTSRRILPNCGKIASIGWFPHCKKGGYSKVKMIWNHSGDAKVLFTLKVDYCQRVSFVHHVIAEKFYQIFLLSFRIFWWYGKQKRLSQNYQRTLLQLHGSIIFRKSLFLIFPEEKPNGRSSWQYCCCAENLSNVSLKCREQKELSEND